MRRVEPSTRYKISDSQYRILYWLFKYRFLTSDLIAGLAKKDRSTIYERLAVLVDQGYVVKKYNNTYRIDRRPASYYLAAAGIRYMKQKGYKRTQIHYKNKDFTEAQIDQYYRYPIFSMAIRANYPGIFRTQSKYELDPEDEIKPIPWLYFSQPEHKDAPYFYLEYFPARELGWIIRKRINQHTYQADEVDYRYPYLLLVAGNDNTEKRIVKMTAELLWDSEIFTTTEERLLSGKNKIWQRPIDYDEDEEPVYYELPMELVDD